MRESATAWSEVTQQGRIFEGIGTQYPLESAELAVEGRRVLGNGESTESQAAWARFFEMAEMGVSDDVKKLIDAAKLTGGSVDSANTSLVRGGG